MCLYPRLMINRKYIPNKKNNYNAPQIQDPRTLYVPVGCGKCMECRKQKARSWSVRLQEQIRTEKNRYFVTLTFSNESIKELYNILQREWIENADPETGEMQNLEGYELDNEIATKAVRYYLERWRKKYGVSVTHWLITEIGKGKTEEIGSGNKWEQMKLQGDGNIHLHGIMFLPTAEQREDIKKIWQYGFVHIGKYCTERTINYCVKYMTKLDEHHKEYTPKILCSPGIGSGYTKRYDSQLNKFKLNGETKETYTLRTGTEINLPIYWRNKIYNEKEREGLWIQKIDKQIRWVNGIKVDISKGEKTYYALLKEAREKNRRLGYGNDESNWDRKEYERKRRQLNMKERLTPAGGG